MSPTGSNHALEQSSFFHVSCCFGHHSLQFDSRTNVETVFSVWTHEICELDGHRAIKGVHDLDLDCIGQGGDDAGEGNPPHVDLL